MSGDGRGEAVTAFLRIGTAGAAVETSRPPADRVVSGSPVHRTWNVEDDGNGLFAGTWESTPGAWRVAYTEWEFCHIVSGVSILAADGGEPVTVRAGDDFVIRPGFTGVWTVVETTRKTYVIKV